MKKKFSFLVLIISILYIYGSDYINEYIAEAPTFNESREIISIDEIEPYNGENYVVINNNVPQFNLEDESLSVFEKYYELDGLGRATGGYAMIDKSLMPTEERGSIGGVKPSGWNTIKYDIVPGKYLYNRCHLIGFQLTGENANVNNLITGTRQFNVDSMLMFENLVADYIKETGSKVLYRVTPIYEGDNLVATGVQMEGKSVEDNGNSVLFNVFVYNVHDGIDIDYLTGKSNLIEK